MLSERQRNIVVQLALAGRTAQYIVDRFCCSIPTIWRIRKGYRETGRWQRLPGSGRPKKTTACDARYLGRLVKRIWLRSLAQVTQEFVTHLGHPVSKRTVQRRIHGQAIYSRSAVQKTNISLENRLWLSPMKTWCGQFCQNIFRNLCRKHIWRQKSPICVSTWQSQGPHGASNCRMVGAAVHIHHSNGIPVPGP